MDINNHIGQILLYTKVRLHHTSDLNKAPILERAHAGRSELNLHFPLLLGNELALAFDVVNAVRLSFMQAQLSGACPSRSHQPALRL